MYLYRGAAALVAGVLVAMLSGMVAAVIVANFLAAIKYNREQPQGKRHSLTSRFGVFGFAITFSAIVLVICTPILAPLWHTYVTPLLAAVF